MLYQLKPLIFFTENLTCLNSTSGFAEEVVKHDSTCNPVHTQSRLFQLSLFIATFVVIWKIFQRNIYISISTYIRIWNALIISLRYFTYIWYFYLVPISDMCYSLRIEITSIKTVCNLLKPYFRSIIYFFLECQHLLNIFHIYLTWGYFNALIMKMPQIYNNILNMNSFFPFKDNKYI